ncbi:hypothetical protein [Mycobacterium sp. SMC-4]|uniref:hypothetical protein n=1 Tax=Mycobacterium sp. SMC-4 TaxID=2857059 RepID=UPI003D019002
MTMFWTVTTVAMVVAIIYVAFGIRAFTRVRRDILQAATSGQISTVAELPDEMHRGFVWKAFGGVVASVTVIALLSVDGVFWYLPVFLAIGSAVAVITAFVVDGRGAAPATKPEL